MHVVLECTSCWYVRRVGMYVVLVCTSCWYVRHVGMYVVLVCTSCWYVRRVYCARRGETCVAFVGEVVVLGPRGNRWVKRAGRNDDEGFLALL
jgi:hypothetical protein